MQQSDLVRAVVANHHIFMLTSERIAATLAAHGLTQATAQALWAIDPDETPPSMTTMTERLFCNAPNLTFVAGQLIKRGLVSRSVDPADRRSRVLSLTEEGRRVRADIVRVTLQQSPFAALDPAQLATIASITDEVLAHSVAEREG
ncbi:MarR family winged helix-turn-helix transcriptional regulator [Protaetiibacter intestinalis]|uniref:MarR family transcriptional regulator n=1 Tax=Protaetiibacter intestinalis TaxID=2419774 RepID=A0A387BA53_9MICO|nr:MarR family transcriptional regulator [Protaetiibacter intestinalis]AYF99243.1 MarR family transcriptional regulator [Protaetiibacter intestinalis]